MADVSLILFDLNGVLYSYDRAARIAQLAAFAGQAPDAVRRAIWDSGFEDSGDAGVLDEQGYLQGFGARIGAALTERQWLAAQQAAIAPIAASLAVIDAVRPGVARGVLTNNNLVVRRHFAALYPEAAARLGAHVHVSAEFNARKPSPDVYRRCAAQIGIDAAATLFVDDAQANVDGAEAAGMQGLLYTTPDDLADALRARFLLVC